MSQLVVTDVTKDYPARGQPLRVLRGVSCQLEAGGNLAILGPSGCGKSTLLHIIGTLDSPSAGRVTLVGQSLGGMYARHMARRAPGMVRAVVTLGSPFRTQPGDHSAVEHLWRISTVRSRPQVRRLVSDEEDTPLSVPSTAIYSRTDGIVNWWLCIESAGPLRESIEVRSSHSGMAVNPSRPENTAARLRTALRNGAFTK